ncbi:MAG TPA: zf-HC2 domain-containing protein [Pyrinomonadaceae bacterium]|nr:zf-HC2 domain-containing protein [Pyrinomonadaceae bacterium]
MNRCLDEVTLQSYFDGELSPLMMERATSHLAGCSTCAEAAREIEQELSLLSSALEPEFEAAVPTERLQQRLNAAVLDLRVANAAQAAPSAGFFGSLSALFNFSSARSLGYASLVILLALAAIFGVVKMRMNKVEPAQLQADRQEQNAPKTTPEPNQAVASDKTNYSPIIVPPKPVLPYRVVAKRTFKGPSATAATAKVKLIPGERSYLQTIAKLDTAIKSDKNAMRPALQVEYERNLAVVDRAIAATRSAAKSNPNDPDAADFMFAAYQSKVDLLNTIADARLGGRSH